MDIHHLATVRKTNPFNGLVVAAYIKKETLFHVVLSFHCAGLWMGRLGRMTLVVSNGKVVIRDSSQPLVFAEMR